MTSLLQLQNLVLAKYKKLPICKTKLPRKFRATR